MKEQFVAFHPQWLTAAQKDAYDFWGICHSDTIRCVEMSSCIF